MNFNDLALIKKEKNQIRCFLLFFEVLPAQGNFQ